MDLDLRARTAQHQAGAGDRGLGTVWSRRQSPAPNTAHPTGATTNVGNAPSPSGVGGVVPLDGNWTPAPPGYVLDLRADKEADSLRLLTEAATSSLPEVVGCALDCAVSLARPGRTPLTEGISARASGLARWDQCNGDGPVSQALAGRLAVILNDYSKDERWPQFRGMLRDAGYRSVVSVPLPLEPGCCAAVTLMSEMVNVFTPAALSQTLAFTRVAASSFTMAAEIRAALAAATHLRAAMTNRTPIDVACGVIMGQNRCSYEAAFEFLAEASSHRNVKARVVAESLLKDLPGGAPTTHFTA